MNRKKKNSIIEISRYFCREIEDVLLKLNDTEAEKLCEIRIKATLPVILIFTDSRQFITLTGRLTEIYSDNLFCLSFEDVNRIFCTMCEYSVHSYNQSITNGYITLNNGCRVGVYGTAVVQDSAIKSVRNIRGMNIRISGEFDGCAERIAKDCFLLNTLICGPPSCGKTTILKALCRIFSDTYQKKTAVIDERHEMSSSYLGYNTDVLSNYPKTIGIEIAVRTLSPDILVFDELGNKNEVTRVIESLNSGVKFITSIHCDNENELLSKEQFKLLKTANAVDCCAFIDKKFNLSKILRVSNNENSGVDNSGTKVKRDASHDEAKETLNSIIKDSSASADAISKANESMQDLVEAIKMETDLENLIAAKIGGECLVILSSGKCQVIVEKGKANANTSLQIKELVLNQTDLGGENITIIEVK